MTLSQFKPNSISTKLIILNILILSTLGSVILTHLVLFGQIQGKVISIVDEEMPQVLRSVNLSKKLSGTLSDIHSLVGMVTVHPENVDTFSTILSGSLDECVGYANPDKKEIYASITLFSDTGKTIIKECRIIQSQIEAIDLSETHLIHALSTLEKTAGPLMNPPKAFPKEDQSARKKIGAALPDMMKLLLQIKVFLMEARLDYSYQGIETVDNESDIFAMTAAFEKAIAIISGSTDPEIAAIGKEIVFRSIEYKTAIETLYQTLRALEKTLISLNDIQTQVTILMSTTDQDIIHEIANMREVVVQNLQSAYTLTIVLSLIGFSVILGVAVYGVRIVKPIQKLTVSAREMAEGNLETEIPENGSDESGRLAKSFLQMRDAIKQKMTDLSGKNQELSQEITERKRAEDELRKYERIVSTSHDLIALIDKTFLFHAVNDAFLDSFKKEREGILGQHLSCIFGEETFREKMKPYLDGCLNGEETNLQEWFVFKGEVKRYMDVGYYPYINMEGEVAGIVINARDITQVKQLETQLLQAQKLKAIGTLAGGIAHDFNNILSAIIGYTELSLFDTKESPKLKSHLGEVLKAAERARDLVRQIMIFSRHNEIQKSAMRIAPIIQDALKMIRASIPKTIDIVNHIEHETGSVHADPAQIHQIILNLCTNAAHAMREKGGILEVSLKNRDVTRENRHLAPSGILPGPYLELAIRDTGTGIEDSLKERIFEPYYTTKEKGANAGTGLGLSTVHGIVQNCGGKIDFESTLGQGTRFRVYLPRIDVAESKEKKIQAPLETGKGRILLVDDEEALVQVGRDMLEHLGYEVTIKTDSLQALEVFMLQPDHFDLIITDQTMPNLTGDELAKKIFTVRPDMPIILYTGFSEKIDEVRAKKLGIRDFILKPIDIRKLSSTIRAILDNR